MCALRLGLAAFSLSCLAAAQERVSFPADGEVLIHADVYGTGNRAVVLAHGGRFTKGSWEPQAKILKGAGFRALAIEFRPADEGRRFDVLAAVRYLRKAGANSVSVVGASMGGDYAAEAAETEPAAIDRLVLLASGAYTPLLHMKGPKLFILSRDDANAEGLRLPHIRAQYEKAIEPKELVIVEGNAHAQFLFQTDQGERVMREILRFLSAP